MGGGHYHGTYPGPPRMIRFMLMFDFDGTLSPIVRNPEEAFIRIR